MNLEIIRDLLAWCSVINIGVLIFWFLFFMLAHDWIYRYHGKWFTLTIERFDAIHYAFMGFYKLNIFIFNLVPYLVLRAIV